MLREHESVRMRHGRLDIVSRVSSARAAFGTFTVGLLASLTPPGHRARRARQVPCCLSQRAVSCRVGANHSTCAEACAVKKAAAVTAAIHKYTTGGDSLARRRNAADLAVPVLHTSASL